MRPQDGGLYLLMSLFHFGTDVSFFSLFPLLYCKIYITFNVYQIRKNRMLTVVPNNFRFQPSPTQQLLCPQDFARNPFRFIDLAGIPSTRPNRFIDLRESATFFQE